KGYTVDMPAAFGGGNVNILTRGIPMGPVASVEIASGYNSESDGRGLSYRGGDDDSLGKDDGTRALPPTLSDAIRTYRGKISAVGIYNALNASGETISFADAEAINRELATSLYRDIDIEPKSLSPDLGLEASPGNSWYLGDAARCEIAAPGRLSAGH